MSLPGLRSLTFTVHHWRNVCGQRALLVAVSGTLESLRLEARDDRVALRAVWWLLGGVALPHVLYVGVQVHGADFAQIPRVAACPPLVVPLRTQRLHVTLLVPTAQLEGLSLHSTLPCRRGRLALQRAPRAARTLGRQ